MTSGHGAIGTSAKGAAMKYVVSAFLSFLWACSGIARAEPIGSVDTVFKLIGPDHKIVVEAYDEVSPTFMSSVTQASATSSFGSVAPGIVAQPCFST